MNSLFREFWPILLPTFLGFLALYLRLPRVRGNYWAWGALVGGVALGMFVLQLGEMNAIWQERALFLTFSAIALAGGFMLVTQANPAHAALSFTLVIIATCGLFLLNGAPFLMAATLIIYAGAIIVTFLFVIMLAAQSGLGDADARSREPLLSCLAGFILLGAMLAVIQRTYDQGKLRPYLDQAQKLAQAQTVEEADALLQTVPDADGEETISLLLGVQPYLSKEEFDEVVNLEVYKATQNLDGMRKVGRYLVAWGLQRGSLFQPEVPVFESKEGKTLAQSPFSGAGSGELPKVDPRTGRPQERLPAANVDALGRSLFTDYLVPVLGAAVLLLVATIGAIAIAGRRGEVLR